MNDITTLEREDLVKQAVKIAMTYADFKVLVERHAHSFTSTGHTQTEAYSNYTVLNERRMKRWDKTFSLTRQQKESLKKLGQKLNWIVITESWCGDAAPSLPIMNKVAEFSPHIDLGIVLRDDNPQLMDAFLTNGNRSIPKLIVQDTGTGEILNTWGARPKTAKQMVIDYKEEHGRLSTEFSTMLQSWYNKNKGQEIASELIAIVEALTYP